MEQLTSWAPRVRSLLRAMAALLFFEHGAMKLLHFPQAMPGPPGPLPPLMFAAGVLELVGGGLLAVGLFSRPVAFLLSGEMAVAYFMVHARQSLDPAVNMGEAAVLYCFVFLYLVFAGPGPWSLDALIGERRGLVAVAAPGVKIGR